MRDDFGRHHAGVLDLIVNSLVLEPDELTRVIGAPPTTSWRIGDIRRNGRPYEFHRWQMRVPLAPDGWLGASIDQAIGSLPPDLAEGLARLPGADPEAQAYLFLGQFAREGDSDSYGLVFRQAALRWMASAGIALDIDQYIYGADEDEAPTSPR